MLSNDSNKDSVAASDRPVVIDSCPEDLDCSPVFQFGVSISVSRLLVSKLNWPKLIEQFKQLPHHYQSDVSFYNDLLHHKKVKELRYLMNAPEFPLGSIFSQRTRPYLDGYTLKSLVAAYNFSYDRLFPSREQADSEWAMRAIFKGSDPAEYLAYFIQKFPDKAVELCQRYLDYAVTLLSHASSRLTQSQGPSDSYVLRSINREHWESDTEGGQFMRHANSGVGIVDAEKAALRMLLNTLQFFFNKPCRFHLTVDNVEALINRPKVMFFLTLKLDSLFLSSGISPLSKQHIKLLNTLFSWAPFLLRPAIYKQFSSFLRLQNIPASNTQEYITLIQACPLLLSTTLNQDAKEAKHWLLVAVAEPFTINFGDLLLNKYPNIFLTLLADVSDKQTGAAICQLLTPKIAVALYKASLPYTMKARVASELIDGLELFLDESLKEILIEGKGAEEEVSSTQESLRKTNKDRANRRRRSVIPSICLPGTKKPPASCTYEPVQVRTPGSTDAGAMFPSVGPINNEPTILPRHASCIPRIKC